MGDIRPYDPISSPHRYVTKRPTFTTCWVCNSQCENADVAKYSVKRKFTI